MAELAFILLAETRENTRCLLTSGCVCVCVCASLGVWVDGPT